MFEPESIHTDTETDDPTACHDLNTENPEASNELEPGSNSALPAFCIDSEERAEWLLRKLSTIQAEKARITEQAKKRTAELDADYTRLLGRFSSDLEAWARQEAERRRRRSVTLLHGTLAFRTVPASLRVGDPSDALTTAKAVIPTAVQTIEQIDRKAFLEFAKQHFATTGELLPGIERTEARETFGIS
jgi:phage host-nuclease inhibitor protein Gam